MGSFRSQPDLSKHSIEKRGNNLSFAASHMCGTFTLIQDGESTWRMHTFRFLLSVTRKIRSLEYSMAMEVPHFILRTRGFNLCWTAFHWRTWEKCLLSEGIVRQSVKANFCEDGRIDESWSWQEVNYCHSKVDEGKRQRSQIWGGFSCRVYSQCCIDYSWVDLLCKCWRFKGNC